MKPKRDPQMKPGEKTHQKIPIHALSFLRDALAAAENVRARAEEESTTTKIDLEMRVAQLNEALAAVERANSETARAGTFE